jgi:CIC family chloride channel protein
MPTAVPPRTKTTWYRRTWQAQGGPGVLLLAAVTGILGGLATVVFRAAIGAIQVLLTGQRGGLVDMALHLPAPVRLVLPALGGIAAGLVLLLARQQGDAAPNDYMHAASVGDGRVPVAQSLLRGTSSLLTIASGGSIGREGAMVQLAALAGSLFGRGMRSHPLRLRLMVACGAAAGLTAAYNAPIASAFFVSEIVLGSFAMESFAPILVAAVIANLLMRALPGYTPTYRMPAFPTLDAIELPLMVVLGLIGGVGAAQFLRTLELGRAAFARIPVPLPAKLGLGGLAVGAISVFVPQVWGNGYSVTNGLLHTPEAWQFVLLILVAKVVATACTTGSGAIGGIFTPTLFVGAAVGWLFGTAVDALYPGSFQPAAYAVVGMGAFLAGATGAPIMAMLMIFEMTLNYQAMLAVVIACIVAWSCARALGAPAMYEAVLKRQAAVVERTRLARTTVAALVVPTETVVRPDTRFDELMRMFVGNAVKYLYVTDASERLLGAIALQDLLRVMLDVKDRSSLVAADFLRVDFPCVVADDALTDALQRMQPLQAERIPVVHDVETRRLVGVVRKSDVIDLLGRLAHVA